MKNSIEIKLLANRRVIYSNRKQSIVITAENRATEIAVAFPDEYEGYSKRVDFVNSHGREWTEALYIPEFKEYAGDFNKNSFKFTLPSKVTTEGELKMQFLAYMPDSSMAAVPFEIITIDVQHGILAFKKNARRNPDLLILSYNQSTEALFKAQQAKAKSESAVEKSIIADEKADEAIGTAEAARSIAQSAEQQSEQAIINSQQAVSASEATEIKVNQIQGTADTAVMKSDTARSVADYAKSRADHAVVRAEDAVSVSTDAAGQAAQAKLKADQATHTANTAQALIGAAITNAETALSVATNIDAKAVTALNRSQEAKDTAGIAENTADDAKTIAQDAKTLIENANTKSESAVTTADQANTKSSQAVSSAQAAVQTADNALSIAQSADGKADTALANSSSAIATAQAAASTADTANTVAAEAKSTALDAKDTADSTSADLAAHKAQNTTALNNKVDKVTGKGLSTEDYTTAEKNKLAGIAAGAEVNIQSDWTESNTSSDAYIKNKPTSMPASGGNADTVDGKHASEFATAQQGDKADTALQSFTETDPTVPAWAKAAAKPSYGFSEITGLMSALQLPDNLINGINNVNANFNNATEQWDVSAEIPFVFECNGINDNERLSNLVKDFYSSTTLADNANLKVVVKGKLGVTNTKLYGSGTYADNYRVFEFGVEGYTGNRRVFLDFSGAEVPEINTVVEAYNYYIIIYNYDIPINIYGLSIIARQTRKEGMSGSGAYLYTIKGNNYNLTECDITSLNEAYNGSHAVVGADCVFNNCSFTVKGSNAVCYAINGDRAKVNNCKFYSLSGDVYTLNSVGAFVQGCHITTIGTSTTQVQCNGKNDCVFINCTLEITGRGTLRCNSGSNCSFINCTFIAESTDINSTVSANQGSNCYFMNCRLTAKGSYWSSSGVSGNSSSGCVFVASVLKATNTRSDGYAYGARVWNGVMIGCELLAYVPEDGTGEAIGFHLNSAVTNKCIIIGCRFREVAEEGYEQGPSIVIDGTDTGGEYMITNNIISGEVRTHSLTGGNYVKEPNIMEGI